MCVPVVMVCFCWCNARFQLSCDLSHRVEAMVVVVNVHCHCRRVCVVNFAPPLPNDTPIFHTLKLLQVAQKTHCLIICGCSIYFCSFVINCFVITHVAVYGRNESKCMLAFPKLCLVPSFLLRALHDS